MDKDDHLDNYDFDCKEAKWLMGFIIGQGEAHPRKTPSHRATTLQPTRIPTALRKIKINLPLIKHWTILNQTYRSLKNECATWFIDPPYFIGGNKYRKSEIDYKYLSQWAKSRKGQIIVCENKNSNWMNFKPMLEIQGSNKISTEVIWSNYPTAFDNVQLKMAL